MKDTAPVRQHWLFDNGWTKTGDCPEWVGGHLAEMEPLGRPRNLFDGDGSLVRKAPLAELEHELIDGVDDINELPDDSRPEVLVLIDDRTQSTNPIIARLTGTQ